LRTLGLTLGALALWRAIDVVAAARRQTGSKHAASFSGNGYPVTIWTFDKVPSVDRTEWRLKVLGRELTYDELVGSFAPREVAVVLDCTGGWWSEQVWRGVGLLEVLHALGLPPTATSVEVVSVTGHAWSFPIAHLAAALLATHVGGEELSPGHGYPVRLAVPGRRGFQWVKWVDRVEVS
jgi:DMSO/TMAO reductase YedYZ molybdopterin-dependent catalytic subunit